MSETTETKRGVPNQVSASCCKLSEVQNTEPFLEPLFPSQELMWPFQSHVGGQLRERDV